MSESIPLCSALGIEMIDIIICNSRAQGLDLMLELLSSERWDFRNIQRQT
jgi:hypothetical protein